MAGRVAKRLGFLRAGLPLAAGLLLPGCGGAPRPEANPAPAAPDPGPLTEARRVHEPRRGRLLDRRDSLLVVSRRMYMLHFGAQQKPLDSAALNRALGWPRGAVQARVRATRRLAPGPPHLPLTAPEAAALRRAGPGRWPGLWVGQGLRREVRVAAGAPVLGYMPGTADAYLRQARQTAGGLFFRLRNGGVESYYHNLLAGQRGAYHPRLDPRGHSHGSWAPDTAYRAGQDLRLGLDMRLQAYAERLLAERRGYVVALEPASGQILAFVSAPTYDPAALTDPSRAAEQRALLQDTARPLLNRPALLANPPGSVFKLVNALVTLQLGAVRPDTSFRCDQSLVRCVHDHPRARNLTQALRYSCNPYFYQLLRAALEPPPDSAATAADSLRLRHQRLARWTRLAASFGLGRPLGTDLGREAPGHLPGPGLYDRRYGRAGWSFRTIYSLSIGQGEINLTGLQLANLMATIANGGWYRTPHFVARIGAGGPLPRFLEKHRPLVDSAHFAALWPGLRAAVRPGGTAQLASLADVGIAVAGKTGTVQNDEGPDHATFAGFAPAENPKIVVAVYLENAGFGGLSAAPLAALLMEKYLKGHVAKKRRRQWEWWLRCGELTRPRE